MYIILKVPEPSLSWAIFPHADEVLKAEIFEKSQIPSIKSNAIWVQQQNNHHFLSVPSTSSSEQAKYTSVPTVKPIVGFVNGDMRHGYILYPLS